jgi:hypothetical protein
MFLSGLVHPGLLKHLEHTASQADLAGSRRLRFSFFHKGRARFGFAHMAQAQSGSGKEPGVLQCPGL